MSCHLFRKSCMCAFIRHNHKPWYKIPIIWQKTYLLTIQYLDTSTICGEYLQLQIIILDSFCNSLYNNLYIQGSKEVFYAGDVHSAKEEVSGLIRTLGFSPIDRGALRNAREIEDIPVQRFPLWKTPLIISTVLFTVLFLLSFSK